MSKDFELKCKVDEQTNDDVLITLKHLGFKTRSEFLEYLVIREIYGVASLLQINRQPGAYLGQESGKTGRES